MSRYEEVLNQEAPLENEHILLAIRAVTFFDNQLISGSSQTIERCLFNRLEPAHMVILANIIKDLDSSIGVLSSLQRQFSACIERFIHNLFSRQALSEDLQQILLTSLGKLIL